MNDTTFTDIDEFLQKVYETSALDNHFVLRSLLSEYDNLLCKVSKLLLRAQVLWSTRQTKPSKFTLRGMPAMIKDGFVAISKPGDDNSFYNAISLALFGTSDYSILVRASVIIVVNKFFSRITQLMLAMDISSLKCIAFSSKVRITNGLHPDEFSSTILCPTLVSAAINAPILVISAFNRQILNLFPTELDEQELMMHKLISYGFDGIKMFLGSKEMELYEPITLASKNGMQYFCMMRKPGVFYFLPSVQTSTTLF